MNTQADQAVPVIRPAGAEQRRAALALVLSTRPSGEQEELASQWLADPRVAELLSGLWVAEVNNRIVGAVLGRRLAGRIATVWPAQLTENAPRSIAQQLLRAIVDWLAAADTQAAQALLPVGSGPEHEQLLAGGFVHISDLLFQICPLPAEIPPVSVEASHELEFHNYEPGLRPRLRQVVERTYERSLDCPALERARKIDDVLDGYEAAGEGGPAGWHLVTRGGRDVGCLLLAADRRQEYAELIYMGIVPEARGKGWGRELVRQAKWVARTAGLKRLALAVDVMNRPAIEVYESAGFSTWERRAVYFRRIAAD